MKRYMAVYTGTALTREQSGWNSLPADDRAAREAAAIKAWHQWMQTHQDAIVVAGGPLGKTKRVAKDGISNTVNNLTGYVVINATSHEDAAAKFENHPHFALFPGEAVEIMECIPIPGA